MKKIIVLILFLTCLSSCITQKRCNAKYPPEVARDSVRIETIKEIPVYLPGDSIKVNVPVRCPDQNIAIIETDRLKQEIKILNGKLISNTHIKKDTIFVPVKEIEMKVNTVIVTKPVKFIPKIYKQAFSICIFIFAVGFGFIGWKLWKFFK